MRSNSTIHQTETWEKSFWNSNLLECPPPITVQYSLSKIFNTSVLHNKSAPLHVVHTLNIRSQHSSQTSWHKRAVSVYIICRLLSTASLSCATRGSEAASLLRAVTSSCRDCLLQLVRFSTIIVSFVLAHSWPHAPFSGHTILAVWPQIFY